MCNPCQLLRQLFLQCCYPCTSSRPDPCNTSCRITLHFSRQFTTATQTFQNTPTSPTSQYSPLPFGVKSIVAHVTSFGTTPSSNVLLISLNNSFHRLLVRLFSHEASHNHPFRSSALIPDGPPALPPFSPLTAFSISASSGTLLSTSAGVTRVGTRSPSGGMHL